LNPIGDDPLGNGGKSPIYKSYVARRFRRAGCTNARQRSRSKVAMCVESSPVRRADSQA